MINLYEDPETKSRYLIKEGTLETLAYYHNYGLSVVSLHPLVRRSLTLIEENSQCEPAKHFDEYFKTKGF
ncbi:hypothetical protein AVV36_gp156 [Pectobacterium bacteriophage PM2]|uniref:Uncharacterized protein n=1 Tax=Pectobacterium bacteriophage PM2 TaxID=1429794 RepID=A0A0A0Q0Q6_9CAUD|nr:hypothetical protein AVV36_gp156 [Pectobacterium bacteriophage PM2]AHY25118.1 hypothetical protein PM2_156 [Pectobacterium bacteriophage PM2]